MTNPILAPNSTWYKSAQKRSTITEINIVDRYSGGTADETWNADVDNSGAVKCYRTGTVLTIAGNGSGKIAMNADSSYLFSSTKDFFSALTTIDGLALFDAASVVDLHHAFDRCANVSQLNIGGWDVSNAVTMNRMFQACVKLTSLDLSNWNVSNVTTMQGMFLSVESFGEMALTTIGDISGWKPKLVGDGAGVMFQMCGNLTSVDMSGFDMSLVTTMQYMFTYCHKLTSVGDLSGWNTSNVKSMSHMFNKCYELQTVNLADWDVSKVTTFTNMFCSANYGNPAMKITGLDFSKWNTSACTNMSGMFYGCKNLGTIDISNWNVSKVENFDHFMAHTGITLAGDGVARWVTSAAKTMDAMLYSCQNEMLDVSNFDTTNVLTFNQMFESCTKLKKIIGLENFVTSASLDFSEMFWNCVSLEELNLSAFDTRNATDGADRYGRDGEKTTTMVRFFDDEINSLKRVVFGKNFSFNGDGTTTTNAAVLPTPSGGMWYNASGEGFAPADVPSGVASSYFSSTDILSAEVLVKYGTLARMADAVRNATGDTREYTASELADMIAEIGGAVEVTAGGAA